MLTARGQPRAAWESSSILFNELRRPKWIFQNDPYGAKVVVSRARNDRFAERYSWMATQGNILFLKLIILRGKVTTFCDVSPF